MNRWGSSFQSYQDNANGLLTFVMIETKTGLNNVEDILDVQGVDGAFIGSYDLSASLGIAGQLNHPLLQDAEKRILDACHIAGKQAGILVFVPKKEAIVRVLEWGFDIISIGGDITFIQDAARRYIDIVTTHLSYKG